jgi:general secretion pathway protein D
MGKRVRESAVRAILRRALREACALLLLLSWGGGMALAQTAPVVKAYPGPVGTVQATADRLQSEFGAIPGVRIAGDERTSQVVAYAPPEVQARISQRLAAPAVPANAAPPTAPTTAAPQSGNQTRSVALRHCPAEQLETSLKWILENRLLALPAARPQERHYRVAVAEGENVDLTLDAGLQRATIEGPVAGVEACVRLVQALDSPDETGGRNTRLVPLRTGRLAGLDRGIAALRNATGDRQPHVPLAATLFQTQNQGGAAPSPGRAAPPAPAGAGNADGGKPRVGLVNPVEIESIEGLNVLVLRGKAQDVEQVMEIIRQIERVSAETEPAVRVAPLRYADCKAMGLLVRPLYDEVYLPRQGNVSITPLIKPNALLIVGRPENVQTVVDLVQKLDEPVAPETQFHVFPLRHAAAGAAQTTVQDFYKDRGGLGPQVRVTADVRSNALLVQAGPRDMDELAALIGRIDTPDSAAVNDLRVIQLQHSLAKDVVDILQSAIGTTTSGRAGGAAGQAPRSAGQAPPSGQASRAQDDQRSAMLRFLTVDAKGKRLVQSGILNDVRITADAHANAVVVSAPAGSMELIVTLIHELDTLPAAEALIKVFMIRNADATTLRNVLTDLFAARTAAGGQSAAGPATAPAGAESSLVPLRFAVDARSNSIIASGSASELTVVEAILMRLDDSDVRHRRTVVFRLKNSYAQLVAAAINQFLLNERQMEQQQMQQVPGITSVAEQIEREVVVVPEQVSNSLILSATSRFFEEIKGIIDQLDARPPMVMIQVLIAQIDLGNTDEFGIELGLQDGLLFDRSLLSNPVFQSTIVNTSAAVAQTNQTLLAANNTPGFNFNNTPLGNSASTNATTNASSVGSQGLSTFGVGRINDRLGFGGLVLSASSESVNILLRALSECHRVEVLQRPQVMTMDNQTAYVQVGQRVPRITQANIATLGQQINQVELDNVGLILNVTPRISPDGLVVMSIDAEKSEVGPDAEGTPVSVAQGQVIRSPRINITIAQTTISAMNGQTVVMSGLMSKTKDELHRKVPWLGDLPVLGRLFRYDSVNTRRTELLIIMTPHIVRNESEADAIKQAEAARMSWCLCDVIKMHGDGGLRKRTDDWSDAEMQVVYPDMKRTVGPDGKPLGPEAIPVPAGAPVGKPRPEPTPVAPPAATSRPAPLPADPSANTRGGPPYPNTAQPANYQEPAVGQAPPYRVPVYR